MTRRAAAVLGLAAALTAACGKKGAPLPPLRIEPATIADGRARRVDDRVEIRFTVPATNADGTSASVHERIEVYGLAGQASAPPPAPAQVIEPANLRGQVEIRRANRNPTVAGSPPDTRPAPGDSTVFVDRLGALARAGAADVINYVLVGARGRASRGRPSAVLTIPIATAPPAPAGLVLTYDERTLTFAWQAGAAGHKFRVYDGDPAPAGETPVRPLLSTTSYTEPVRFNAERCLTVRAAIESGPVLIEGSPAPKVCATPVDTFPPAAPGRVLLFAGEGSVELTWDAVAASDLAGYVVLRGEGSGDTLLRLTAVLADLHYTDRAVTRGATYWYAVVAEDARGNVSAPSVKQQVTVRMP